MADFKACATAASLFLALSIAGPAMAQGKSAQHGNGHGKNGGQHQDSLIDVHIDIGSREIIRDYYGAPPGCPPGLAKKHNGCLPPGQAKKRYELGHPLSVSYRPLPGDLLRRLPPPPSGYIYGRVDNDVLLIAEATRRVVDAVEAVIIAKDAVD